MKKKYFIIIFFAGISICRSQTKMDSVQVLKEVAITAYKTMNGIGHMKDDDGQIIYAGKKNEVLVIDSLDANKAINNTRQIIGRIPGLNIAETETGGFTANGVAFRGLNPIQSIEVNTRQNGYNISADSYGYNESYYLPPMEAVKDMTFVRGAASLAFGPQIGGMINYQLKDGGPRPLEITTSQTIGTNGLFNSFTSVGGTYKKIQYYGFLQFREFAGWRVNSQSQQYSGFASVKYDVTKKLKIGLEYTGLRNTVHMPGGLTDSLFKQNPQESTRARNWLQSPWNILAATFSYKINDNTSLSLKSVFNYSERDLVWRNEDGGPQTKDTITPSLAYTPREVEHEYFRSSTNEFRFLSNYHIKERKQTLAFGVRYSYSFMERQHGGNGTTGSDMDFTITPSPGSLHPWGGDMKFNNTNIAPFIENTFRVGSRVSITPGLRYEFLKSVANGYDENVAQDGPSPYVYANKEWRTRSFLLPGVGLQIKASKNTNIYANYSQSYRPITYDQLTPFGTIAKIDPNLKDANADNVDIGYRGTVSTILNFDVGLFYINYRNRIGLVNQKNDSTTYPLVTNTGNSENKGLETYFELNILNGLLSTAKYGKLSIYNSYAYINARYYNGPYAGNQVEYAPKNIERVGLNYKLKKFSFNVQYSYTSMSFTDAANTIYAVDALVGIIPSYHLVDLSSSYKINQKYQFKLGINNLTNEKYFTMRTTEYPGPGIIPSIGRMIYAGVSATF